MFPEAGGYSSPRLVLTLAICGALGGACGKGSGVDAPVSGSGGGPSMGGQSGTGGPAGSSGGGGQPSAGSGGGQASGSGGQADAGSGGGQAGAGGSGAAGGAGTIGTGGGGQAGAGAGGAAGRAGTIGTAGTGGGTGGTGTPTPAPSLLGDVTFSTPSQAFQTSLSVTMSTTITGAEIRYTTDRSRPVATSPLYAGTAVAITRTTQLRAQPFLGGAPAGTMSTALYILRDFDTASDIPLMIVDGYGQGAPTNHDVFVECAVMTFEPRNGEARLSNLPTVATRAGYHERGSSSATFPQKSYRVELRDNADTDADYPLLGMPAEADWALVAPYRDRALIRNTFTFELGRAMGLAAPRVAYAEVYVNYANRAVRSSDYVGIYYVTETIKNAKNRLNLQQLRATDTTLPAIAGGYIFKFDWMVSEEPKLPCVGSNLSYSAGGGNCWTDLEVVDPDPLGPEQKTWLTSYVQEVHNTLHAAPIGNYAARIDLPSFVDNFIVNELVRNLDAFTRSAYYHKDRDGKLKAGPLWDYNYSLDCGKPEERNPEGWQYLIPGTEGRIRMGASDWYPTLMNDPAFRALVVARWKELRSGVLAQAALDARIAALAAPLARAAPRDIARWPVSGALAGNLGPTAPTWEGQVQAIRDWLPRRLAWLDTQLR